MVLDGARATCLILLRSLDVMDALGAATRDNLSFLTWALLFCKDLFDPNRLNDKMLVEELEASV